MSIVEWRGGKGQMGKKLRHECVSSAGLRVCFKCGKLLNGVDLRQDECSGKRGNR